MVSPVNTTIMNTGFLFIRTRDASKCKKILRALIKKTKELTI